MKFLKKLFFGYLPYTIGGILFLALVIGSSSSWETRLGGGVFLAIWGCGFITLQLLIFVPSIQPIGRYQTFAALISISNLVIGVPLLAYLTSTLYQAVVTPLNEVHYAVRAGNVVQVERLIDRNSFLLEMRKDFVGLTPLETAIASHRTDVAAMLIRKGVNVEKHKSGRATPLIGASANGDAPLISLLLNAKANVNAGIHGEYCGTPLLAAVLSRSTSAVRVLLDGGADPNLGCQGDTPLINAAQRGSVEIIDALLAANANPNFSPVNGGFAPLHTAIHKGDVAAVRALLRGGANPNIKGQGNTPLELAIFGEDRAKIFDLLRESGAK